MWLVQRFYEGGFECGSIEEPFFVTADRDLAQTISYSKNNTTFMARV